MKKLISYFIEYPIVANLSLVLVLIFGYFGLSSLNSSFFPETKSDTIVINVTYPGASPEEIEQGVVLKIEDNIEGLTGVDRFTSVSKENSATVTIKVKKGYNTDLILQDVKNEVDRISSFPNSMEPLEVFKKENVSEAIRFAISGDISLKALKSYARDVEDELRAREGISKIKLSGFPEEEIEVGLSKSDLRAYNLTFTQVSQAVREANIELTGGTIKTSREEMLIRADAKRYYADQLRNIVVKTGKDGSIVRLKDVADVQDQWKDNPERSYLNGKPAVIVKVQNTIYQDILGITEYVRGYIKEFNKKNDAVKATIIRDRSESLNNRISLLTKNGLIGFSLVLILLTLFLNIRLAFWVAVAIPFSFMGMFILAGFYGITINVISLFGMILVIGILVDDGIVFGENIYQKYEDGVPAKRAAIEGTIEILPAVIASVFTTIIAFSTFFFLAGRIGEFIVEMAFVVNAALLFSLIEGFLILPSHMAHSKALHQRGQQKNILNRNTDKVLKFLRERVYSPLLWGCLQNKTLTMGIGLALLLLTVGLFGGGYLKTTFFPNIERNQINVNLEMASGTRAKVVRNRLQHIKKAAWEVNDSLNKQRSDDRSYIQDIQTKTGPASHKGSMKILLLNSEYRKLPAFEITNLIRSKASPVVGATKLTYGSGIPFGKPVSIALKGEDIDKLKAATAKLKKRLKNMEKLRDVVDNDQEGLKEINLRLKEKAHMLGLDLMTVMQQVRNGFFGQEIQRLQRGLDEVKVWVRFKESGRRSIEALANMRIRTPNGNYPLKELATYNIERGVLAINHRGGEREINVQADLADPKFSASNVNLKIENEFLPEILAQYPSIDASFEGQTRESGKVGKSAAEVLPIILILMLAVVMVVFRSVLQTFLIFLILPFGLIGVAVGHVIQGIPVSILSTYGIIALIGIIINNAVVLVTYLNRSLKTGKPFTQAVHDAGIARFRPILLTTLTTIGGLAPLMFEQSLQAQFLVPMAVSVAYGMMFGMFVTLLILPVMLILLNRLRYGVAWLWTGQRPVAEQLEPSVRENQTNLSDEK